MRGIFCGNFSISRVGWPCYTSRGQLPKFIGRTSVKLHLSQGVECTHVCIPFQCELCWMRNLEESDPINGRDDSYLVCIRCANLNAITGKSPLTILAHLRETRGVIRNAKLVNKTPSYHPRGPFPLLDPVGGGHAPQVIYCRIKDRVQFSTIRRIRSTQTKNYQSSSPMGVSEVASFAKSAYIPASSNRNGAVTSTGEWSTAWALRHRPTMACLLARLFSYLISSRWTPERHWKVTQCSTPTNFGRWKHMCAF